MIAEGNIATRHPSGLFFPVHSPFSVKIYATPCRLLVRARRVPCLPSRSVRHMLSTFTALFQHSLPLLEHGKGMEEEGRRARGARSLSSEFCVHINPRREKNPCDLSSRKNSCTGTLANAFANAFKCVAPSPPSSSKRERNSLFSSYLRISFSLLLSLSFLLVCHCRFSLNLFVLLFDERYYTLTKVFYKQFKQLYNIFLNHLYYVCYVFTFNNGYI